MYVAGTYIYYIIYNNSASASWMCTNCAPVSTKRLKPNTVYSTLHILRLAARGQQQSKVASRISKNLKISRFHFKEGAYILGAFIKESVALLIINFQRFTE